MSKKLSKYLGVSEPLTKNTVDKLEGLSGYQSRDVRLLAETNTKLRSKIADMQLDPNDTKAKELYHSLIARLEHDLKSFEKTLACDQASKKSDGFSHLKKMVEMSGISGDVWVLKRSAAKQLLVKNPPKKLMRFLKYRSVQSMLKRENIDVAYLAIEKLESTSYLKKLHKEHLHLGLSNFESRPIRIVSMQRQVWKDLAEQNGELISSSPLTGTIALWPSSSPKAKSLGVQTLLMLQALEGLRFNNLAMKIEQTGGSLQKPVIRLLQHHHVANPDQLAELFGPHLQSEDLKAFDPAEIFAKFHHSFRWWANNHHLAKNYKGKPVSFNLYDVLLSYLHELPYERRVAHNFQEAFWHKLILDYLPDSAVEEFMLIQLSNPRWQLESIPAEQPDYSSLPRQIAGIV